MTASRRVLGSDLAKVDRHVVRPDAYDEAPELDEAWFDKADRFEGDRLVRRGRGRPRAEATKQQVTLRLDRDVLERFRATGKGWQLAGPDQRGAAQGPWVKGNGVAAHVVACSRASTDTPVTSA